jgi:hypothetical protein
MEAGNGRPDFTNANEMRFQDPDWLAWWLSTHYLLPPAMQMEIASVLGSTIHRPECKAVLDGFVEYLEDPGATQAHAGGPTPVLDGGLRRVQAEDSEPFTFSRESFIRLLLVPYRRYRGVYFIAGITLGFYAIQGVVFLVSRIIG